MYVSTNDKKSLLDHDKVRFRMIFYVQRSSMGSSKSFLSPPGCFPPSKQVCFLNKPNILAAPQTRTHSQATFQCPGGTVIC